MGDVPVRYKTRSQEACALLSVVCRLIRNPLAWATVLLLIVNQPCLVVLLLLGHCAPAPSNGLVALLLSLLCKKSTTELSTRICKDF
jgi:hypothetical protein